MKNKMHFCLHCCLLRLNYWRWFIFTLPKLLYCISCIVLLPCFSISWLWPLFLLWKLNQMNIYTIKLSFWPIIGWYYLMLRLAKFLVSELADILMLVQLFLFDCEDTCSLKYAKIFNCSGSTNLCLGFFQPSIIVSRLPNELRHFAICIVNLSSGQFGLFWFLFSKKIHYIIIATETLMYSKWGHLMYLKNRLL